MIAWNHSTRLIIVPFFWLEIWIISPRYVWWMGSILISDKSDSQNVTHWVEIPYYYVVRCVAKFHFFYGIVPNKFFSVLLNRCNYSFRTSNIPNGWKWMATVSKSCSSTVSYSITVWGSFVIVTMGLLLLSIINWYRYYTS